MPDPCERPLPPRWVVATYRRVVQIAGARHCDRFGRDQIELFETLWATERPHGAARKAAWLIQQFLLALRASVAVRRDARPRQGQALARTRPLAGVLFDLRLSVRSLLRSPWFSLGAVLTFALGIGVNVAVFSAVDRMLFRALPYADPEQLVVMEQFSAKTGQASGTLPAPYVVAAAQQHDLFAAAAIAGDETIFRMTPEPIDDTGIHLVHATVGTLRLLGGHVSKGRDFVEQDARSRHAVALIGHRTWQLQFGGREDVLGARLWTGTEPTEIVGVLPPGFLVPASTLSLEADGFVLDFDRLERAEPKARSWRPYLRLASGVSLEAAQSRLDALLTPLRADLEPAASPNAPPSVRLVPLSTSLFGYYANYLWLVAASSALVFLIACVNLASLFLVRGRSRDAVVAMQLALGAPRARVLRAAFVETALLAVAGAALALVAFGLSDATLRAVLPAIFSRYALGVTDVRVLVVAALTATMCALAATGAYTARAMSTDLVAALQRSGTARGSRRRVGSALIVAEAALSVVLVVGAAVTIRNFTRLTSVDIGYDPSRLATVSIAMPRATDRAASYQAARAILDVLRGLPGVATVGAADAPFLAGAVGNTISGSLEGQGAWRFDVTEGLIEAIGLRMVSGRTISADDIHGRADVAVLGESAVQRVWPGVPAAEAVGRVLELPGQPRRRIIGVTTDLRASPARPRVTPVFVPIDPATFRWMWFHVKADGPLPSIVAIRDALRSAGVRPTSIDILDASMRLDKALSEPRFRAALLSMFGFTALVLAVIGLYAITAFDATQRRREVGIRLAIGANGPQICRLLMRDALRPVAIGVVGGLALAFWAAKSLEAFVVEVDVRDPVLLLLVAALLFVMTAIAAWIPARRAARTDPAIVLRAQ